MKKPGICQICLHTDKVLQRVHNDLSDFHDELCFYCLDTSNAQYCLQCAHMLKKLYIFRIKCKNAVEVFKKWKQTNASQKKPAHLLHELLPPSSLGLWTPKNSKMFTISNEDATPPVIPTQDTKYICIEYRDNGLPNIEVKQEENCEEISEENFEESTNPLEERLIDVIHSNTTETDTLLLNENYFKEEHDDSDFNNDVASAKNDNLTNKATFNLNDHCYTKNMEGKPSSQIKKSLGELANMSFCDFDDDENYEDDEVFKEEKSGGESDGELLANIRNIEKFIEDDRIDLFEKIKVKKRRNAKKKNKEKDAIDLEFTNISLDNDDLTKKKKKKKSIAVEFTNISLDENCSKMKPKPMFCKERLKTILQEKFDQSGDIRCKDGTLIDKQLILKCLDNKVNVTTMKALWNVTYGKNKLNVLALGWLKCIQRKFKKDCQYETMFDIEYLNSEEKIVQEFQNRKTLDTYINSKHKCDICCTGYKYENYLNYHMKAHEDNEGGEFVCTVCNARFKKNKDFRKHIVDWHSVVYKCKICSTVLHKRMSMVHHYEQHLGKKRTCEKCGKTLSVSGYFNHIAQHQTAAERHACKTCGRNFTSKMGLRTHVLRIHEGSTPAGSSHSDATCDECQVTFRSVEVYFDHVRVAHRKPTENEKLSECYNGEMVYMKIGNKYRTKRKIGRKIAQFTCRVCNEVGNSYGWLTKHFIINHPTVDMEALYADTKTHLCHICGKGFSGVYSLRDHVHCHSSARVFACDQCPKRFRRASTLDGHRQRHQPPRHPCQRCGKMFRTLNYLSSHMRTHIGDRCYKCDICGKGFLFPGALKDHIRSVHHHIRRQKRPSSKTQAKTAEKDLALTEEITEKTSDNEYK